MILVTGATGNNGGHIIAALRAAGAPVRALVRAPAKAAAAVAGWRAGGVEVAVGDMADPQSLASALRGADAVLLLSPVNPNQVELQGNVIRAAAAVGVNRVVKFSMIGAADDSPVPLARWHRQTEAEVERSGLAWTHLRPNDLMGYNTQLLLPSIDREGAFYDPLGDARVSMVDEGDVAAVAAKVLTEPGHEGKTYVLTGPEPLSFADVAGHLSAALGRPVRYVPVSFEQAREAMRAGGLPEPAVALVEALRRYEREGHNAVVTPTVGELLGRPPLPYAAFAAEFAARLGRK